jgi:microcompartment protein CcmK/EutM
MGMRLVQPLDFARRPQGQIQAAVDAVGAGPGELVITISSYEASLPFDVGMLAVDLAIIGIVDRIDGATLPRWHKGMAGEAKGVADADL